MPLLDKEAVIELHVASKGFVFSSRKLPVIVLKMGSSEVFYFSLPILGAPNHYGLIFSTRCQVFSIWTDVQIHNATTMTLGHNWEDDLGLFNIAPSMRWLARDVWTCPSLWISSLASFWIWWLRVPVPVQGRFSSLLHDLPPQWSPPLPGTSR